MKAVIFAGGVGSRLWPLSRENSPKQFLKIVGNKTMIQLAVDRYAAETGILNIYIATGAQYVNSMREQLPDLPPKNIIAEPEMRDVGPAVAVNSAILARSNPDEPVAFVYGADHIYKDEQAHKHLIETGRKYLESNPNKLILIGEKPRFANENIGWISFGAKVSDIEGTPFYQLEGFKYRPEKSVAVGYFEDGHHSWNLGDFMSTPGFMLSLLEKHAPELYSKAQQIAETYGTEAFESTMAEVYPTMEKIHNDHSIIERMDLSDALVIQGEMGWTDIGAWEALKEVLEENEGANVTKGGVVLDQSTDCLVYNFVEGGVIAGMGLEELVIVNTGDVLFISKKALAGKVKDLAKKVDEAGFSGKS
jgi:mannose-1-phosphate guanylyltransferase